MRKALKINKIEINLKSMEDYIVSARKYRPLSFDSVVGQHALTTTLKNAVRSGKLAHAYLFCGPRGVGKTTCARIFAKAINCMQPTAEGEACNECESCKSFAEQRSFNIFELDAASNNSVENIKQLMEQTRIPPQVGRYKVFIIDEVHMLSAAAFNAFLKTLEEPPAHVIFILATTEKHKILPTILSRCQIYDFERMTVQDTIEHLKMVATKEGITFDDKALALIAEKADGGMRDALSIFDQAASFCQGNITYEKVLDDLNELDADNYFKMVDMAMDNKVSDLMLLLNGIIANGFDGGNVITGLASHIRNVLMAKDSATLPLLQTSKEQTEKFREQAQKCPVKFLYTALKLLNQCDINYRQSSNKRLLVELTLIQVAQITQPDDAAPGSGLRPGRLKTLFKNLVVPHTQEAVQAVSGNKPLVRTAKTAAPEAAPARPSAPASTVGSAPRPMAAPRLKLGSLGMTFAGLKQREAEKQQKVEAEEVKSNEDNEFDSALLELQWRRMCNRMPQQMTGLAQRMKNITPHIAVYPNIEVVVDNKLLLDQINAIKGRIKASLMADLHNGQISLTIRLAEQKEIVPVKTSKEVFDELRKTNKSFNMLVESLQLEF